MYNRRVGNVRNWFGISQVNWELKYRLIQEQLGIDQMNWEFNKEYLRSNGLIGNKV